MTEDFFPSKNPPTPFCKGGTTPASLLFFVLRSATTKDPDVLPTGSFAPAQEEET